MEAERRQKMKKGFWGFTALGLMLAALLLAAVPAGAQSVDDKIKALEQELGQLKSQQMELKKEATAAAAALPSFSYRPGNGINIEAADKSWGIRFGMEAHIRTLFESGQDAVGRTNGEVMLRRWRPNINYCIDNCLYEIELAWDMDGFGTGNAKNSINSATSSIMQRGVVHFHLENLNPFLPTVDIGGDISTSLSLSRQGSSAVGTQMDYDLLTRNFGPNTGRAGWGYVFNWDDRSLSGIGIPGRIGRYQFAVASINEGDDNLSSNTDRKDFGTYINIFPFSQLKNKWIQGFMFEFGAWFCNVDQRASAPGGNIVDNGCGRIQIRDNGDSARQVLFDTGANTIGEGLATLFTPGITWEVGPYRLRAMGAWAQAEDKNTTAPGITNLRGKKRGHDWLIGHDLYLWSPKGFLTGSANTPGSILVGTHFERTDVSCTGRCNTGAGAGGTLGQFHRGTYIIREWDLWYFIAPRMSIGGSVLWYDASNLTTTVQKNLGTNKNGRVGGGGSWFDGNLNWRYQF
jgi:hypothetical protein